MFRHVLFAIAILAGMAGSVQADVGVPSIGPPDFAKSSPAANASFGLSLAAMLICGGYWVIRNPRAGLASLCLGAGIVLLLLGLLSLAFWLFVVSPFLFGGGAILVFWSFKSNRIFQSRVPFVGVNLLFLLLSLGGAVATIISLDQLTWPDTRAERRRQRQQQMEAYNRETREKQALAVLGTSTLGLLASPQGQGPFVTASAIIAGTLEMRAERSDDLAKKSN